MKVLAVAGDIDLQRVGGAEAHFIEVLKRISPKLEKAVVLVGENTSLKNLFVDQTNVEIIKIKYPKISNFNWLTYSLMAIPFCLRGNFDLLWLKQEYLGWVGLAVKLLKRKPVYVTCQNPNLATEEWAPSNKAITILQKYLGAVFNRFLMFPLRFMDTVAAVSSYSADLARKYGAKRVVVIPNGVDTRKFQVKNQPSKSLKIVTTSSLIPRNGIDTLIAACGLLDFDFELTLAGDGPEKDKLENLAIKLGIINRVKFLGRVSPDLVPSLLATSNLFIRPSRYEGFGNVFIEAMTAGLPVIATRAGGIKDFIFDEETGFVVPVDNPDALAEKIKYVLHNPQKVAMVKKKARKMVEEKYDWDIIAKKVLTEMFACL